MTTGDPARPSDEETGPVPRPGNRDATPDVEAAMTRLDQDADGVVTDAELAAAEPPARWKRLGLHGPAIVLRVIARNAKRLFVAVVGATFVLAGVAMLVLPGPGFLVVLVGLVILATEFVWAERLLDRTRARGAQALSAVSDTRAGKGLLLASGVGLLTAGVLAIVVLGSPVLGASLLLAGTIGLATLVPAVQRKVAHYARAA